MPLDELLQTEKPAYHVRVGVRAEKRAAIMVARCLLTLL
jgi:hypothetical protein